MFRSPCRPKQDCSHSSACGEVVAVSNACPGDPKGLERIGASLAGKETSCSSRGHALAGRPDCPHLDETFQGDIRPRLTRGHAEDLCPAVRRCIAPHTQRRAAAHIQVRQPDGPGHCVCAVGDLLASPPITVGIKAMRVQMADNADRALDIVGPVARASSTVVVSCPDGYAAVGVAWLTVGCGWWRWRRRWWCCGRCWRGLRQRHAGPNSAGAAVRCEDDGAVEIRPVDRRPVGGQPIQRLLGRVALRVAGAHTDHRLLWCHRVQECICG